MWGLIFLREHNDAGDETMGGYISVANYLGTKGTITTSTNSVSAPNR
jgi:hypothetical protein